MLGRMKKPSAGRVLRRMVMTDTDKREPGVCNRKKKLIAHAIETVGEMLEEVMAR